MFVVGSLNADHRVRVTEIPKSGETVIGSAFVVSAGGKGANQAVAAARAGAPTLIVGFIGDDSDGEVIRRALTVEAVDTGHLHVVASTPTGRALITVDDAGENTIVVSPGANSELTSRALEAGLAGISPGDHVLLQLETPTPLVLRAARAARESRATVVLNAAPVPDSIDELLDLTDLLVVNEHELVRVTEMLGCDGIRDLEHHIAAVARASGATVICTAGSAGAYVWHGDRAQHFTAPQVTAVDTTAAGDTFIGYLAAALSSHPDDITGATEHAMRAAAVAVTRPGAIDAIPLLSEISPAALRNQPCQQ
ncbi:ribokinase [Mycobacterium sp. NPDC003449]